MLIRLGNDTGWAWAFILHLIASDLLTDEKCELLAQMLEKPRGSGPGVVTDMARPTPDVLGERPHNGSPTF